MFNLAHLNKIYRNSLQCLIERIAHVTINISYFVMLLLYVSAHRGHLQGGHSQRNTFIISAVQDVHIYAYI